QNTRLRFEGSRPHTRAAHPSSGARKHERDVVWLLLIANPVVDGGGHAFGDFDQRQIPILAYQVNQPGFAKLAEIILWFSDSVTVGEEYVTQLQLNTTLVEGKTVKKAYHHTPLVETAAW